MTNQNYMYGVLCESESGLDAFGNPISRPILLECMGEQMNKSAAIDRAIKLNQSKQFGRALVVRFEVCNFEVGADE